MWKGVVLGFSVLSFILIMFLTVFSKIMPGIQDDGEELAPDQM